MAFSQQSRDSHVDDNVCEMLAMVSTTLGDREDWTEASGEEEVLLRLNEEHRSWYIVSNIRDS